MPERITLPCLIDPSDSCKIDCRANKALLGWLIEREKLQFYVEEVPAEFSQQSPTVQSVRIVNSILGLQKLGVDPAFLCLNFKNRTQES